MFNSNYLFGISCLDGSRA